MVERHGRCARQDGNEQQAPPGAIYVNRPLIKNTKKNYLNKLYIMADIATIPMNVIKVLLPK
jgi:hypothetical protein